MASYLGARVVRGPDWEGGDQDGGEGFVGTIVELEEGNSTAKVQWDAGLRQSYLCGLEGKYELRILDCAPAGVQHGGWVCSWCSSTGPIAGTLWQCLRCYRYSLCSSCYHAGKHCLEHEFERVDGAGNERVRVGSRMHGRRVASQGVFQGAVVMRGADWRWGDQDGGIGCQGSVVSINDWEQTSFRSVAHVKWSHSLVINLYRVGHLGNVDLQCVSPSSGGYYYPDHLPVLGKKDAPSSTGVRAGDGVRVELDPEVFKAAQEEHGGWGDHMAEYIGRDGVVHAVLSSGDVMVRYSHSKMLYMNKDCLTPVECCTGLECGDVVRVCEDMAVVHRLQSGHGEWADDMALSLGQVGRVVKVYDNGDVRVAVNGSRWKFNPDCLSPAPGETPIEEKTGELHVDVSVRIQCVSLTEASCADVVVVAAAGGDLDTLTRYLQHHPEYVNRVYEGETALHVAAVENYLPIVRVLISCHADLNIKNQDELTALHLCAALNNSAMTQLLLEAGADANIRDDRGASPLALACICGSMGTVRVLLDHPRTNLNTQNLEGNSPLHKATNHHQLPSLIALLEAGADPTILNHLLQNCMHTASGAGFLAGVEELMKWYPDLINKARKDGFTALHIAAVNGHTDIVSLLASHPRCDVNVKDNEDLTPLQIAAYQGYPVMLERLVGYGADLNSTTSKGNTALHLAMGRDTMAAPSLLSPHILEVKRELDELCGPDTLKPSVVVGVFLVREGAKIHAVNHQGQHPLSFHPPDVRQLVNSYADRVNTMPPFHGQLCQTESPFADVPPRIPRKRLASQPHTSVSPTHIITPTTTPHHHPTTPSSPPAQPPPVASGTSSDGSPPSKAAVSQRMNMEPQIPPTPSYDKDINPYAKVLPPAATTTTTSTMDTATGTCRLEACSLCEECPVSIMLQPCGHVTLCHVCGARAKRCMNKECRAEVKNVIRLCPVCLRNQPDETHSACNTQHTLCRGCVRRSSSKCPLCFVVLK